MKDLIVQKFGGTSVANIERIQNVAKIINRELDKGNKVAVVVSAMAGVTDSLVKHARDIISGSIDYSKRELDVVMASGEIASSGLLALALDKYGIKAKSYQSWQIKIHTNDSYSDAKISNIDTEELTSCINYGVVPIICGFQGIYRNSITTLGRGGSDTTAAAISAALGAQRCDIYTDVDGIYSADPNLVKDAKKLDRLSYEEVVDMAYSGAKVLHPRAAEIGEKYNIPITVLSSYDLNSKGTIIQKSEGKMEKPTVKAVLLKESQALITLKTKENISDLYRMLPNINFNIEQFFTNADNNNVIISTSVEHCKKIDHLAGKSISDSKDNVCRIAISGIGIKNSNEIIEKVFNIVHKHNVKIILSVVLDNSIAIFIEGNAKSLVKVLHKELIN